MGECNISTVIETFGFLHSILGLEVRIRHCMASGQALSGLPPNHIKVCCPRLIPGVSLTLILPRLRKLRAANSHTDTYGPLFENFQGIEDPPHARHFILSVLYIEDWWWFCGNELAHGHHSTCHLHKGDDWALSKRRVDAD